MPPDTPHTRYRASITLHTAFGTPLAGDTLFGQLCWAAREHKGEAWLTELLQGYTEGSPWLVTSDAFPAGYLPKPTLPQHVVILSPSSGKDAAQRKVEKGKVWIPATQATLPLDKMQAVDAKTAFDGHQPQTNPQPHNSLSRLTGTASEGFAPYTMPQTFYAQGQRMEIYLVADDARISKTELLSLLTATGLHGFARDASIGLGKFTVEALEPHNFASPPTPNAWWTLAPCAPQGQGFDVEKSYWRVITRFGRHGNLHVLSGQPFKNPLLMCQSGAVFAPPQAWQPSLFVGQGLGGVKQLISKAELMTVAQGYAPVVAVQMERFS